MTLTTCCSTRRTVTSEMNAAMKMNEMSVESTVWSTARRICSPRMRQRWPLESLHDRRIACRGPTGSRAATTGATSHDANTYTVATRPARIATAATIPLFESATTTNRAIQPTKSATKSSTPAAMIFGRSEEHTSELQSHHDLVCRLLLEK